MDLATLKRFESHLQTAYPNFRVCFKDQSWAQKLLGFLMIFNPGYMTEFITTIGSTVYFPTQAFYEASPEDSVVILAHESVHIYDSQRTLWFKLSYLFPQVLALVPAILFIALTGLHSWVLAIPLVGYVIACGAYKLSKLVFGLVLGVSLMVFLALGCYYTGWSMLVLLGLVVLAPWPAPWRVKWELRGYGMTLAVMQWVWHCAVTNRPNVVAHFVDASYFFMSWSRAAVDKNLEATRQQAEAGALQRVAPYSTVYAFLESNRLLYGQ